MKKITLAFSVLAASAMFFVGCKKPVPPVAPEADTELQTSIDASYMLFLVTDAEMIGSFISDNSLTPKFYMPTAASVGSVSPVQDTAASFISFGFNNTSCADGRFRDGTVILDRDIDIRYNPNANANSRYYRAFGFSARMTLSDYKVDGWRVVTANADNTAQGEPCLISNTLPIDSYDPAKTNITWTIKGNFKLKKGTDSMFCRVDLVKTLANTSTPTVFPSNKKSSINWPLAIVKYTGTMVGTTLNNVPFAMQINQERPITRDFKCSPDQVMTVAVTPTPGVVAQKYYEYHPFINGVASFTTSTLYPRQIYYGGSETDGEGQCDNSGAVLIKGISYPIDFKK